MYGPVGMQVHAGTWEHEALREAKGHRRGHTDSDYLKDMEQARPAGSRDRVIAAAAATGPRRTGGHRPDLTRTLLHQRKTPAGLHPTGVLLCGAH